jgi:hypothetical protein
MNHRPNPKRRRGFVSYVLVLTTSLLLTTLMVFAYRRALSAQSVQASVQLQLDYSEKEETILRSIVAITPNRAIRAMQGNSNNSIATRQPLRWDTIFTESLTLANAHNSVQPDVLNGIGLGEARKGNSGDATLGTVSRIFRALPGETGIVSRGINRNLGAGFPAALNCVNATDSDRDLIYPIITSNKVHGALAEGRVGLPTSTYPVYNLHNYPQINFGYARPGEPFVAKRNWWGFVMDLAAHDTAITGASRLPRQFVLSIYEIPSQLAISASSFMSLGQFASGEAWQNVNIDGGVFAGRAVVEGETSLSALASRRSMQISDDSTIGGRSFNGSPFTPGVREEYQLTEGDFFPVSLASESGRAAFIPINRGADYFDRFSNATESNAMSQTTWNNYSVGALQCAMRLDITDAVSDQNPTPTSLRFSYISSGSRQTLNIPLNQGPATGLPPGYIYATGENNSYTFNGVVDLAYGANGFYAYQQNQTGLVTFNNARFGDPLVGTYKYGYYRPSYPFEIKQLDNGKFCVAVYPQRFPQFLSILGGDGPAVNHSLVVNVDYPGSIRLEKPSIPTTELDYGVILQECADLTPFTKGFSLVTNLRLYMGDDFNIVPATPPAGYTPTGDFFPPCSLFAPERRYGVEVDPFAVQIAGQVGSLASETAEAPVRPLDSVGMTGTALAADRIRVNLRPIRHPAELPPITMVNWLVLLEERRAMFTTNP